MSITNVGANSSGTASPGTSVSWSLAQTVTLENLLIVLLVSQGDVAGAVATASANPMVLVQQGGPGPMNVALFKLEDSPAGVTQVTVSGVASSHLIGIAAEFNPSSMGNDNVADTGVTFTTSPWASNELITGGAGLVLVGLRVEGAAPSWTVDPPYMMALQVAEGSVNAGLAWADESFAGTYSVTGTTANAGTNQVTMGSLILDEVGMRGRINLGG